MGFGDFVQDLFGVGGDTTTTTTSRVEIPPEFKPYITRGLPDLEGAAQSAAQSGYYPGDLVAGYNPWQNLSTTGLTAQGLNDLMGLQGYTQQGLGYLAGPAMNVAQNPYVNAQASAITDQIGRQLSEYYLPNVNSEAFVTDSIGGSRQDIAQAQAAERAATATAEQLTNLYGNAYGQGLNAYTNALMNAPQFAQVAQIPAEFAYQQGSLEQAQRQAEIDAELQRYLYNQDREYNVMQNYLSTLLGGTPYGQTATVTPPAPNISPFQLGVSGASLGGSLGGPYGAAAGGILGLLGGFAAQ